MPPIFYTEYGKGFPIVLLHGFCETQEIWDGIGQDLSDEFRVIAPDLPGFGKSPLPTGDLSLVHVADLLSEWLDAIHIEQCILIGHSLGGYVTLAFANKYPQYLKAFGLFNSSAMADGPEKRANRDKLIEFIRNEGVGLFIRTFVPSLFYPERVHEFRDVVERIKYLGAETDPETVIAYASAMKNRPDLTELLTRYSDKVLLIAGMEDQNVPLAVSQRMARSLDQRHVHILPETAHMTMFEQKDAAAGGIRSFAHRLMDQPALG
jgi:pimeloyl-ACP methyl ester carboxylesterase